MYVRTGALAWAGTVRRRRTLAYVATGGLVTDLAAPVTATDVGRARDVLVERQDTHLDSLAARLAEPRVRRVIEPMLAGTVVDTGLGYDDDVEYVSGSPILIDATEKPQRGSSSSAGRCAVAGVKRSEAGEGSSIDDVSMIRARRALGQHRAPAHLP